MIHNFHPSILRLLRVFHAVARYEGFTAAESFLGLGQSTISNHIKELEEQLGFCVCERGRSGFRLTAAGEKLYGMTQRLERDLDNFIASVNEINNELRGSVRFGVTHNLANVSSLTGIPQTLNILRNEYPAIRVDIHVDTPQEIEQGIKDGRYDLGISGLHVGANHVDVRPIFGMRMILCCSLKHPLFYIPDSELCDESIRRHEAVLNAYDQHLQLPFHAKGAVIAEASEVSIFYILSGSYIGYLSEFLASSLLVNGQLRALCPRRYFYHAPGGLLVRRQARINPVVQKVADIICDVAKTRDPIAMLPI